ADLRSREFAAPQHHPLRNEVLSCQLVARFAEAHQPACRSIPHRAPHAAQRLAAAILAIDRFYPGHRPLTFGSQWSPGYSATVGRCAGSWRIQCSRERMARPRLIQLLAALPTGAILVCTSTLPTSAAQANQGLQGGW